MSLGIRSRITLLTVAATAPLKLPVHVMRKARDRSLNIVQLHYNQTAVLCALWDVRIADGERLEVSLDKEDPEIPHGKCYTSKDSEALEVFAYPRDYLGTFDWWPEYELRCRQASNVQLYN